MLCRNRSGKKVVLKPIETVDQGCSVKKVFLEILQNSQENTFSHRTTPVAASELTLQNKNKLNFL